MTIRRLRDKQPSPTLVFWNTIPSPNVVDRLNVLADRRQVDFEAWFNEPSAAGRSWAVEEHTWRFRHRYLPSVQIGEHKLALPTPLLVGQAPAVLICLHGDPAFVIGHVMAKLRRVAVAIRVLATFDSWVRRYWWKEALKRLIFRSVDAVLVPGRDAAMFAAKYGAERSKVHLVDQVVDVEHFTAGAKKAREERTRIRADLGLRGTTFLYVGRLWMGKGLEHLFEAYGTTQKTSPADVSLLIVGDGVDEARLRWLQGKLGLRNVTFVGFQAKARLPEYYAASDVLVFPTLGDPYGLVVDEAMASELPVISTTAAGEIHARVDDSNGALVPPGDSAALERAMVRFASGGPCQREMARASRRKIAGKTPESWAAQVEEVVRRLQLNQFGS